MERHYDYECVMSTSETHELPKIQNVWRFYWEKWFSCNSTNLYINQYHHDQVKVEIREQKYLYIKLANLSLYRRVQTLLIVRYSLYVEYTTSVGAGSLTSLQTRCPEIGQAHNRSETHWLLGNYTRWSIIILWKDKKVSLLLARSGKVLIKNFMLFNCGKPMIIHVMMRYTIVPVGYTLIMINRWTQLIIYWTVVENAIYYYMYHVQIIIPIIYHVYTMQYIIGLN